MQKVQLNLLHLNTTIATEVLFPQHRKVVSPRQTRYFDGVLWCCRHMNRKVPFLQIWHSVLLANFLHFFTTFWITKCPWDESQRFSRPSSIERQVKIRIRGNGGGRVVFVYIRFNLGNSLKSSHGGYKVAWRELQQTDNNALPSPSSCYQSGPGD